MKGLKKFKEDHFASDFVMGMFLNVGTDYYRKMEKMKDEEVPPMIKERLNDMESISNKIKEFYDKQEEFFMSNDLLEIVKKANKSVEDISNETIISPKIIKECIFEGHPFPNNSIKDNIIDYCMFLYDDLNQQNTEPSKEDVTDTPDLPEIPTVEDPLHVDHEFAKKDAEIAGLNRQLEWYEQIIDTFSKLANLASKGN